MDPWAFLRTTNAWERNVTYALAAAILELEKQRDVWRAGITADEVVKRIMR